MIVEKTLSELVARLQKSYGDRLVSVVLYGSAVSGDYQSRFSDLNLLCVLSAVTARELGEAELLFRWWRERGNPAPLLLAEAELPQVAASFAMEFRDLQRQ